MENGEKLEITYCYPVPNKDEIEQVDELNNLKGRN
jgi:hypothetical protein